MTLHTYGMTEEHLFPNLENLDDDQISDKYNQLLRRHQIAAQSGMALNVLLQLEGMLHWYEEEQRRRLYLRDNNPEEDFIVLETDPLPNKEKK